MSDQLLEDEVNLSPKECQESWRRDNFSLGARGNLPSGYIVSSLRVLKQFAQSLPSGYVVSSFTKYPPKYPLGTF